MNDENLKKPARLDTVLIPAIIWADSKTLFKEEEKYGKEAFG